MVIREDEAPEEPVLVYQDDALAMVDLATSLSALGFDATRARSQADAQDALRGDQISALVVVAGVADAGRGSTPIPTPESAAELASLARRRGIPLLLVVDPPPDPDALAGTLGDLDDWVTPGASGAEIAARLERLLRRRRQGASDARPALRPDRLALIVHDLRTPLNVIGLSLPMIAPYLPQNDPECLEDMRSLVENFQGLTRMLALLGDYQRLLDRGPVLEPVAFGPGPMVQGLLEAMPIPPGTGTAAPRFALEVDASCPSEVVLDLALARFALVQALENATAAAEGSGVRVVLRGEEGRWITEVVVDRPPPETVRAGPLRFEEFQRIQGVARERLGVELALAARVSALFGGTARLEVVEGQRTAVVLDWPTHPSADRVDPRRELARDPAEP